ncbi:MAG: Plasmid stabilization system [Candidatus Azambacteria bacterium GW2011_GWE1_42_9]|nr:MAG: Plasmid stabilization system [Candidatus Azambacteria bacterium GW2011_GWF1_41_10]KKS49342.1 MAG: Plasmid stabilization system [Candidatus Azambacteria bacterium GW2011_GWF2_42_22]KKS79833.1 MAG: Plasmid stabilization system [Candidatus Azambacteria bacterium GW2011_GWE1_42_9]KKT03453.1 MAG: Plasmid stabilization system [Candidatus Azambacteria bacterium GW2011_GWD1_43_18]KKT12481.1 MAG: Plasmid stabilization system [Candidatus Azambacteria bacterium GW2011_GWC2_43_27]KKT16392.1 MAG: P
MKVSFKPTFIRQFKRLDLGLQQEANEKIELFEGGQNLTQLKIHKLHGRLAGWYSFSVNYKTRVVFCYLSKKEVALLAIGDHAVYDK